MARAAGSLHTAIGLQARLNPAVRRAAELLSSGEIGRPLNARIVSTTSGYGPEWSSAYDYLNKTSSGANLLTITGVSKLGIITPFGGLAFLVGWFCLGLAAWRLT